MRIVLISDTHGLHHQLDVPNGDLLIHAGDFTCYSKPPSIISGFNAWLGSLPHRHKILTCGDHEFWLEEPRNRGAITIAILLIDSGVEVDGVWIWGSPTTPLYGGAFGISRAADRKRHWSQIPQGLDILITHGPPFGVLDCAPHSEAHGGCPELREAVLRAKPRVHIFGHIHAGFGTVNTPQTTFINVSLFDEQGKLSRDPVVIELKSR